MTTLVDRIAAGTLWETRRASAAFFRRFGLFGAVVPLCGAVIGLSAALVWSQQDKQAHLLRLAQSATERTVVAKVPAGNSQGRNRLKAFDEQLLAHDDIPEVVQEMLDRAGEFGLVVARGDYKPLIDAPGGFLRYRMTLPIKGESHAVASYIRAVLRAEPMLVLEAVRFKRERADSSQVEARIQWTLLTKLPPGPLPKHPDSFRVQGVAP